MSPVSALTAVAFVAGVPVRCTTAHLVLDEGWAPYAAAEVTIAYTPALAAALDPHTPGTRVVVELTRHWHYSLTLADLSQAWTGLTLAHLSAEWVGLTLADLSDLWSTEWESGLQAPDVVTADLAVRSRAIDYAADTITVRAASDELLAQDPRVSATIPGQWAPTWFTAVLAAAGLTGAAGGLAAALPAEAVGPETVLAWSTSIWDTLTTYAAMFGLRLWCDVDRTWHLSDVAAAPTTTVTLTRVSACEDTTDRDGDYADAIVWTGTGTNNDGATLTATRVYPDPIPAGARVHHVEQDYGPVGDSVLAVMPSAAELALRLARLNAQARVLTITATADPTVRPGVGLATGAPSLPALDTIAARVEWTIPDDTMTITTRTTTEA